jgi:methylmalonyl-CoA mutase C-terminal domain/subunit
MTSRENIRILLGKPGLDGHDQGVKVVAHLLRDAGFEVIYTGLHQSPVAIAKAAMEEDVDLVGLSILSGAHLPLTRKVREEMKNLGITDTPLVVGGNIPEQDIPKLVKIGVSAVLRTGSSFETIVEALKKVAKH